MTKMVDQDAVLSASNGLDGQCQAAVHVLDRYMASVNNANAPGSWRGPSVGASTVTGEEIHAAQKRLQDKFQMAIQVLRQNVHGFGDVDAQNVSNIQAVTNHITLAHQ
jgi:uncharacterized protein YukE